MHLWFDQVEDCSEECCVKPFKVVEENEQHGFYGSMMNFLENSQGCDLLG